jgi:Peptidase family M28
MRPLRNHGELLAAALGLAALACSTSAPIQSLPRASDHGVPGAGNSSGGETSPGGGVSPEGGVSSGNGPSSGGGLSSSGGASSTSSSGSGSSAAGSSSSGGSGAAGGSSSGGGSPSSGGTSDGGTASLDPDIEAIVAGISSARVWQTIQALAAFGTRSSCSTSTSGTQGVVPARDWIKAQFDAIGGLTTSLEAFAQSGCAQPLTRHNVIAVLPGTTHPNRVVIIGGHYDSRTVNVADGTSPAPGANDSGSQTSVVLELARVMVGHPFDATLAFVAFAGEEEGLVGSKALSQNIGTIVAGAQVVAMLNCDIVGGDNTTNDANALQQFRLYSPGTPREVGATTPDGTTDNTSPSRGLMRYVAAWGSAYVPSMTIIPELREDRPGRGGDHESFIASGYPGVRFIEPTENLAHEHTAQDLPQYVTPDYSARVAQVVAAVAANLARAPDMPAAFAASGSATGPALTWTATATASASGPGTSPVDHFAVAARPATENFYHASVPVAAPQTAPVTVTLTPAALSVDPTSAYFLSVAAVDAKGHQSLFAYPEYRCDAAGCVVPPGALDITATK